MTNTLNVSSNGNEKPSIEQYLEKIRPYLGDMIDDLRISGIRNINLSMNINFISSKTAMKNVWYISKVITEESWLELIQMKLLNKFFNQFFIGIEQT